MVFESSCWATDSTFGEKQLLISTDNSLQSRSKIDYFNVNTMHMPPPAAVFHISSNGYYGYCPTPHINTDQVHDTVKSANNVNEQINHITNNDAVMTYAEQQADQRQQQQLQQHQHQQQHTSSAIKRKRCHPVPEYPVEVKRCRNIADCIDDVQMNEDDDEKPQQTPSIISIKPSTPADTGLTNIGNSINNHINNTSTFPSDTSSIFISPPLEFSVDKQTSLIASSNDQIKECHISWTMMSHMT